MRNLTIPSYNDTKQKWSEFHEEDEQLFTTEIYQALKLLLKNTHFCLMSMDYPERNVKYECASYKSVYLLDYIHYYPL